MSWLRLSFLVLASLFLLLLALSGLLLFSASGNALIWQQTQRLVPGLQGELVSGQLATGWTFRNVRFRSEIIDVDARAIDLRWQLGGLFTGRIPVEQLRIEGARVNLHIPDDVTPADGTPVAETADATVVDTGPFRLRLPIGLDVRSLQIDDTVFTCPQVTVKTDGLQGALHWKGEVMTVEHLVTHGVDVALADAVLADDPHAPHHPPRKPLSKPFDNAAVAKAIEQLPSAPLPFDLYVTRWQASQVRYHQKGFDTLKLDFDLQQASYVQTLIRWQQLAAKHPWGDVTLGGQIDLQGYYPLQGTLHATSRLPWLDKALVGRSVTVQAKGPLTNLQGTLQLAGSEQLKAQVQLNTLAPELPFVFSADWQHLQWPLKGKADYQAGKGKLHLAGRLDDYQLDLQSALQLLDYPAGQLATKLRGSLDGIQIANLTVSAGETKATASGKLDWQKGVDWQGDLALKGDKLHELVPAITGRIEASLPKTAFHLTPAGQWSLQLPTLDAKGQLNGYPLTLSGSVTGNDRMQWQVRRLFLRSGDNQLALDGSLGEQWMVKGRLEGRQLKQLHPLLDGALSATLDLGGNLRAPVINVKATSQQMMAAGARLRDLSLDSVLTLGALPKGHLALSVARVRQDSLRLDNLSLQAEGDSSAHTVQLSFGGKPLAGGLTLKGSLAKGQWQGELQQAALTTPVGKWGLVEPLRLVWQLASQRLALGKQCWQSQASSLCVEPATLSSAKGELALALHNFDTAQLAAFLPDRMSWQTRLSVDGTVGWVKQQPYADLKVQAGPGKLLTDEIVSTYDVLNLTTRLTPEAADVTLQFDSQSLGNARIDLKVAEPLKARTLSGNLDIKGLRLHGFAPLVDELKRIQGRVDASGRMAGTLDQPLFYGHVALDEGELETYSDLAVVKKMHAQLDVQGHRADLSGSLMVGKGRLELGGYADWGGPVLGGRLTADADTLEVGLAGYGRARVSANLVMQLGEQTKLEGRVLIPWARIKVKSVPDSAVTVSDDVHIVRGNQTDRAPPPKPAPFALDINLGLGGDVQLDAFGLKTSLQGGLRMTQSPQTAFRADGEIRLENGRFKSFGQNLLIKEGKLQFTGNIAAPYLAVKAERDPETMEDKTVTIGVKVSGPVAQPKIDIYSEPALSETEKLSYLLRGKSTSSSGGTSNDEAMAGILLGAGLSQANDLVSGIGENLGLRDLSLDSSGSGDATKVSISGYVFPGLQIQYGVGVFSSMGEVKVKLELLPRLYLQALSGLNQALDLFYNFEF